MFPGVAPRLVDFVLHDRRFHRIGLRTGANLAFRELYGRDARKAEIDMVVKEFWQIWHDRFDRPRSPPPIGGGSPYSLAQEMSPWQENAIRALEDGPEMEPAD